MNARNARKGTGAATAASKKGFGMGGEWSEVPLGEVVRNFDSRRIPLSSRERLQRRGQYRYFGATGVMDWVDGFLFEGLHLLVAEDGSVEKADGTPFLQLADGKFWVNNHAHVLRGTTDADTRFLYYALSTVAIRPYISGSVQAKLNQGSLNRILVPYPGKHAVRSAIAHVLGSLDDKIELNRRMSETLEAMARTLFKSWFVDFDPVRLKVNGCTPDVPSGIAKAFPSEFVSTELGQIPHGWTVAQVGDVALITDCLHSKKPERTEGPWTLLALENIRNDGLLDLSSRYAISESDYREWTSRFEACGGDCVITNVGRVGAVAQIPVGTKAALGRNMTGLRCKKTFPYPTFLLQCLLSESMRAEIERKTDAGTILDALNVRNVPRLRFVRGPDPITAHFESSTRPLRSRMETLLEKNRTLGELRDTLLPKLLSGELRIPDAEKIVGEAV